MKTADQVKLDIAKRRKVLGSTERVIADIPNNQLPEAVVDDVLEGTMRPFVTYHVDKLRKSARITWKVMHSGDLDDSFTSRVTKTGSKVVGRVSFLFHGRFPDMGVGKGKTLVESQTGRALLAGRNPNRITRRPKPWLSEVMARERHRLPEILAENIAAATAASVANALPEGRLEINV